MREHFQLFFTKDRNIAFVIMLNAIVLFFLSFEQFEAFWWLSALDAVFLFYFLMEAIVKVREGGWKNYWSSGWNRFDFLILVLSFPSIFLLFAHNFPNLAFIYVFRVVRVLRFFKFIKFIPNIRELVAGIRRAFKASIFVLLAFFVYSFIISLISCRLFQDAAPQLFGDPLISFYNIFKVFTIEGWYEVPEALIQTAEPTMSDTAVFFVRLYFVIIVVSGGLFGLSIVNAIFVEEMVRDNNDDLILKVEAMDEKLDQLLRQLPPENGQDHPPLPTDNPQTLPSSGKE